MHSGRVREDSVIGAEVIWTIYSFVYSFKHRCLLSTYVVLSAEPRDAGGFAEVASRWTEWSGMRPGTFSDGCQGVSPKA